MSSRRSWSSREQGTRGVRQSRLRWQRRSRDAKFDELEATNKKIPRGNSSRREQAQLPLEQITLQVTGLRQLTRPEVVKALKLTDEQVAKFKDLQEEARKALEEIINATPSRAGKSEKLAKSTARRPTRRSWRF